MSRYTIGDHSNPKHNTTKSMVGLFPLAPHHDYLQYMYHVYLMQTTSKPGCYNSVSFYEPGKNQNRLGPLILGFESVTKVS